MGYFLPRIGSKNQELGPKNQEVRPVVMQVRIRLILACRVRRWESRGENELVSRQELSMFV